MLLKWLRGNNMEDINNEELSKNIEALNDILNTLNNKIENDNIERLIEELDSIENLTN
jgi:hypothetical protein